MGVTGTPPDALFRTYDDGVGRWAHVLVDPFHQVNPRPSISSLRHVHGDIQVVLGRRPCSIRRDPDVYRVPRAELHS